MGRRKSPYLRSVFLLIGECGEGAARKVWPIMAHTDAKSAAEHARLARAEAKASRDQSSRDESCRFEPRVAQKPSVKYDPYLPSASPATNHKIRYRVVEIWLFSGAMSNLLHSSPVWSEPPPREF